MSNYVRAHIDILELADLRAQLAEAEKLLHDTFAEHQYLSDEELTRRYDAYRAKYPKENP